MESIHERFLDVSEIKYSIMISSKNPRLWVVLSIEFLGADNVARGVWKSKESCHVDTTPPIQAVCCLLDHSIRFI